MERDEFRDNVKDAHALLALLQKLIPRHVSDELLAYLQQLEGNPVGLELLRNAIASAKT